MHELKHKHTTIISLFDAIELNQQLADAIDLLNKNANDGKLEELKGKTLKNLDDLIDNIDKMIQGTGLAE